MSHRPSRGLVGAALAALALTFVLVVGLAVAGGEDDGSASDAVISGGALAARTCSVTGPVRGLTSAQAANADHIVSVAMTASRFDTRAARIVLVATLVESDLENLDRAGGRFGLFQLRPGTWGTPAQLMVSSYASAEFTERVLARPQWRSRPPWTIAQEVEGAPPSEMERFRRAWPEAAKIVTHVLAHADHPGQCGQGVGSPSVGGHGPPPGYVLPPATPPEDAAVVRFALAQLGKPFLWGASGTPHYDSSGLTMAAWASVGVVPAHAASSSSKKASR